MSIYKSIKEYFSPKLTEKQKMVLKNFFALFICNNLTALAKLYVTDKAITHSYTQHYMKHLRKFKYKKIKLFEIGVGGNEKPNEGGNSLKMWKKYFPFGKIYSLDLYEKSALQEKRIIIYQGSQADAEILKQITDETGLLDIIIDDGSHINEHIIESFKLLFPKLKDGGVYVIEDLQTSYWEEFGGDSKDLKNSKTAMNFFKGLTDCLNYQEIPDENYKESYFDKKIVSIHFYHNLVFIDKGNNDEESNMELILKRKNEKK